MGFFRFKATAESRIIIFFEFRGVGNGVDFETFGALDVNVIANKFFGENAAGG